MISGIGHVAIRVKDIDKNLAFYRDILGFQIGRTFHRKDGATVYDLSRDPSQIGEIQLLHFADLPQGQTAANPIPPQAAGVDHVALLVEDMAGLYEHLLKNGVEVPIAPRSLFSVTAKPGENQPQACHIKDPNGVTIELITWVHQREDAQKFLQQQKTG